MYTPVLHFDDINGRPLVGGKLYTYKAGTSTPEPTYRNSAGTELNENPILLNERGECEVCIIGSKLYKLVLKDALDNVVWEADNVSIPSGGGGSDVSITPVFSSGVKIADFSVDGEEGELFAPGGSGSNMKTCLVILEISGTFSSSTGILWDGKISEDVTMSVSYKGTEGVDPAYLPTFVTDGANRIVYRGGALSKVIALNTTPFINSATGFSLTGMGFWGSDTSAKQIVGNLYRTFDVSDRDIVMNHGFRLINLHISVSDSFRIVAIGTFLAPA